MARTNFAKMFAMTPEASFLSGNPDYWIKLLTTAGKLNPDQPIFAGSFGDTAEDESRIAITRRQWLLDMVGTADKTGIDRLTVAGGGPEVLLCGVTEVNGQFLGQDFNLQDRLPVTACVLTLKARS